MVPSRATLKRTADYIILNRGLLAPKALLWLALILKVLHLNFRNVCPKNDRHIYCLSSFLEKHI